MWDGAGQGVVVLPSGRRLRGRAMRAPADGEPDWGLYLTARRPTGIVWPFGWIAWRDFWIPRDDGQARAELQEAWERSARQRVEVGCRGGVGRTGTALAAIGMLDGLSRDEAVAWVRRCYHPRAVETPWQRRWLAR